MNNSYNTILKTGYGVYEEKKSRFLGEAIPVSSAKDISSSLDRIRKQYYDARHHCYAWILGEKRDLKKVSDDGEPSGTAGLPILKVMEGAECTNLLIIVTRYFGGTLLGTGGLVRAYTNAARGALINAGIVRMNPGEVLQLTMDYSLFDSVSYYLRSEQIQVRDTAYTDKVVLAIIVPSDRTDDISQHLKSLGAGRIQIGCLGKGWFGFPDPAAD